MYGSLSLRKLPSPFDHSHLVTEFKIDEMFFPPTAQVRDHTQADADRAPEEDLQGEVGERVEAGQRDEKAQNGAKDGPQDAADFFIDDFLVGAVDRTEGGPHDPQHGRSPQDAVLQQEGEQTAVRGSTQREGCLQIGPTPLEYPGPITQEQVRQGWEEAVAVQR